MLAKIINNETKQCDVFLGTDTDWAVRQGFSEMDVEQAYNGAYFLAGNCPEPSYIYKRQKEYPVIADQLDMIYWDKVNNTNLWQEKIAEIKAKYPKE